MAAKILMLLPFPGLLFAALTGLHGIWFFIIFLGVFAVLIWLPEKLIFDFQEKKLFRSRFFKNGNFRRDKAVSFADWNALEIFSRPTGKKGNMIHLVANNNSGKRILICCAEISMLPLFLEILPDMAEKLGSLPIVLR